MVRRAGGETSRRLTADTFEVHGLEPGHPRLLIFAHKDLHLVGLGRPQG